MSKSINRKKRKIEKLYSGSEIWIGDLRDYKEALRLTIEDYKRILVYEYDSSSTRKYLFALNYTDRRPNWELITKYAIDSAYSVLCTGGEFEVIKYPGIVITRSVEILDTKH